jgi:hypothetical protein
MGELTAAIREGRRSTGGELRSCPPMTAAERPQAAAAARAMARR